MIKVCFSTTHSVICYSNYAFFLSIKTTLTTVCIVLKLWFAYRVTLAGWQEDQWWDHFRMQRLHYPSALWTNLYTLILLWKQSLVITSSWLKAKNKRTEQLDVVVKFLLVNLQHSINNIATFCCHERLFFFIYITM